MEADLDPEHQQMMEGSFSQPMQIDPRSARFPCSIVWSPLPVISWFIPFIGHIGICREDGVILDFAGPNYVCVDNFAFGSATRYLQISKEKLNRENCEDLYLKGTSIFPTLSTHWFLLLSCFTDVLSNNCQQCCMLSRLSTFNGEDRFMQDETGGDLGTWDDALGKSTQEFQHRSYNLLTCNCHSFVANNLNRLGFLSGGWNVVNLAIFVLLNGCWVSKASMLRSILPFVVVFFLGVTFGGLTFLTYWSFFSFSLIGWFLLGTYCFKSLIHL